MTTSKFLKYEDKNPTTQDITGDPDLAGSLPQEAVDALKVSQIVKQLKGDYVVNSELNQKVNTTCLSDIEADNERALGRAACEANRDYYQALADKAKKNYAEYLLALDIWQTRLNRLKQPL